MLLIYLCDDNMLTSELLVEMSKMDQVGFFPLFLISSGDCLWKRAWPDKINNTSQKYLQNAAEW